MPLLSTLRSTLPTAEHALRLVSEVNGGEITGTHPLILDLAGATIHLAQQLIVDQSVVIKNGTIEFDDLDVAINISHGGVTFEDLWIKRLSDQAGGERSGIGIAIARFSTCTFSRVRVENFGTGIELRACSSIRFIACNFAENDTHVALDSLIHLHYNTDTEPPTQTLKSDGNEDVQFLGCTFGEADGTAQVHFRGKSLDSEVVEDDAASSAAAAALLPRNWPLADPLEKFIEWITIEALGDVSAHRIASFGILLQSLKNQIADGRRDAIRANLLELASRFEYLPFSNNMLDALLSYRAQLYADREFVKAAQLVADGFDQSTPEGQELAKFATIMYLNKSTPASTTSFIHCRFTGRRNSRFSVLAAGPQATSFVACRWESARPDDPDGDTAEDSDDTEDVDQIGRRRQVAIGLYQAHHTHFTSCTFISGGAPFVDISEGTKGVRFTDCTFPKGSADLADLRLNLPQQAGEPLKFPYSYASPTGTGRNVRIRHSSTHENATRLYGNHNVPDVFEVKAVEWYR